MTGRERQPVAYRRAWIGGAAVAGVLFFWLVTVGSWNPLHLEAIETSGFYDAQVHSWFEGRWDVPLEEVGLESFVIDGRNQMYFGPVPALLRVPVLAFTDRLDHRLSALSMTAAYAVTMAATALLGGRIRRLRRGPEAPVSGAESLTTFGYFVLLGGASLVTFLASRAWVYHEAVLWGIAFAMAAFVAIFDHVTRPSARTLVLATVFTTAAVGSRLTVGLAAVGALAAVETAALMGVLGRRLTQRRLETPVRWLGSARVPPLAGLLPVAVPVVLYGLVNWVRFGQVIGIPFDRQIYVSQLQPDRVQVLADVGPSGVALEYLPTNLVEYLRPDGFALDRLFPFVTFPRRWPHRFGDIAFAGLEPTASLTFTMPVILGLALFGLVVVFRRGSEAGPSMAPLRPLVLGGALAALATLCFAWNAHRYQGDFLPLLIVASLAGFHELHARRAARGPEHRRGPVRTWTTRVLLGGLVVALVYVNVGLALVHQRVLSPNAVGRSEFAAFQQDVDELLFSDRAPAAEWGTVLPDDPEAGRLFVIGECDGLYQSIMDGPTDAAWAHWRALERTAATGGYRFRMTFPTRPAATTEPVLVSGPPGDRSLLAVEGLGDGRARFSLALEATGEWFRGEPFAVADGEERLVEIAFDARTLEVAVDVDGEQALRSFFWRAYPGAPITVGRDGAPMVAPRFTGDLVDEPLATPLCDRLAARREG